MLRSPLRLVAPGALMAVSLRLAARRCGSNPYADYYLIADPQSYRNAFANANTNVCCRAPGNA